MRLTKYLLITLACLVTSCSLFKTTYNNAPALVIWRLDSYFNFTQAQNLVLKPSLQNLHTWHRQNQLPQYLTLLQNMQKNLASEQISADQVCEKINSAKQSLHTLQIESIPIVVEMAPLLSDKQLQLFQKKLSERAEEWKSDWWQETTAEQLAVRLNKAQDFAEDVYGNLNADQIKILKQSLTQTPSDPAISYKEILRRNHDAFQILSELRNPSLSVDEKLQLVKAGFERTQKSPNQTYQNYADTLTANTCATIAALHASTNPQQKSHAKNWLDNYIVQLTALQIE